MNFILYAFSLLFSTSFQNKPVDKIQIDGPYVFYKNDLIYVRYIYQEGGLKYASLDSFPEDHKKDLELNVATDEPGQFFKVKLKSKLSNEKSEFSKPAKMLVISDIEANFRAFKALLIASGVIDKEFNWIFGKGDVVFTGDFFDRGSQQNEVLWLMYALEEKAREAKGYVHYVLGNHEIMNLNGDFRYVHPRYMEHAKMMNEPYINFYSANTELGRWLRTKNVTLRVGDFLFIHGGISPLVNEMGLPASEINSLARPYYADTSYNYPDIKIEVLYSDLGPFWYRGYYSKRVGASRKQIDSTLNLFNVKYIATGHTIIAEKISLLYDGRVINTDVHHADGHSEALLVEDGKMYRINAQGEKIPLTK